MKFGESKNKKYANYILSKNPEEITFEETVLILKKYLRRKVLYSTQDGSAKTRQKNGEDYSTFLGIVNRE